MNDDNMDKIPSAKKSLARIWAALFHSLNGLRFAITNETAFMQEVSFYVVLLIVLYLMPLSVIFKCILLFANTIVLLVELLNSAIESVVDMASPGYNLLAKRAKDLSSAAVLISIALSILLWLIAFACVIYGVDA
jgi:diacylglycerol kinase (ATP)